MLDFCSINDGSTSELSSHNLISESDNKYLLEMKSQEEYFLNNNYKKDISYSEDPSINGKIRGIIGNILNDKNLKNILQKTGKIFLPNSNENLIESFKENASKIVGEIRNKIDLISKNSKEISENLGIKNKMLLEIIFKEGKGISSKLANIIGHITQYSFKEQKLRKEFDLHEIIRSIRNKIEIFTIEPAEKNKKRNSEITTKNIENACFRYFKEVI